MRTASLTSAFQIQAVWSVNPIQVGMEREIQAVRVPVTAKVQRMRKSWVPLTFHLALSFSNIGNRDKNFCRCVSGEGIKGYETNLITVF